MVANIERLNNTVVSGSVTNSSEEGSVYIAEKPLPQLPDKDQFKSNKVILNEPEALVTDCQQRGPQFEVEDQNEKKSMTTLSANVVLNATHVPEADSPEEISADPHDLDAIRRKEIVEIPAELSPEIRKLHEALNEEIIQVGGPKQLQGKAPPEANQQMQALHETLIIEMGRFGGARRLYEITGSYSSMEAPRELSESVKALLPALTKEIRQFNGAARHLTFGNPKVNGLYRVVSSKLDIDSFQRHVEKMLHFYGADSGLDLSRRDKPTSDDPVLAECVNIVMNAFIDAAKKLRTPQTKNDAELHRIITDVSDIAPTKEQYKDDIMKEENSKSFVETTYGSEDTLEQCDSDEVPTVGKIKVEKSSEDSAELTGIPPVKSNDAADDKDVLKVKKLLRRLSGWKATLHDEPVYESTYTHAKDTAETENGRDKSRNFVVEANTECVDALDQHDTSVFDQNVKEPTVNSKQSAHLTAIPLAKTNDVADCKDPMKKRKLLRRLSGWKATAYEPTYKDAAETANGKDRNRKFVVYDNTVSEDTLDSNLFNQDAKEPQIPTVNSEQSSVKTNDVTDDKDTMKKKKLLRRLSGWKTPHTASHDELAYEPAYAHAKDEVEMSKDPNGRDNNPRKLRWNPFRKLKQQTDAVPVA